MTRRILVIDPVHASRTVTRMRLVSACYNSTLVEDAEAASLAARRERPHVIVIDMPDPGDTLHQVRRNPRLREVPVIVVTDAARSPLPLLQAGAADVLARPVDESLLLARLRAILRLSADADEPQPMGLAEDGAGFEMPATIAFVTDRTEGTARMRGDLVLHMTDRLIRTTREDALQGRVVPDLFVIESALGGAEGGLRLMSDLRAQAETRNVPICILQCGSAPDTAAMAWDLGADEVVPPQIGAAEMALRLSSLLRMKRRKDRHRASVAQGLRMAMVDPLTGLHNRRFAMPQLEAMARGDMAVLLIDLDRFKSVNDRWGHASGDTVLAEVASRLADSLRPGDLAARIGGEEFLIALPDTQLAHAFEVADRLCQRISAQPITLPSGESLSVTISIGLATRQRLGHEAVAETVERADRALLQSKAAGRNRVTVASAPTEWTARSA